MKPHTRLSEEQFDAMVRAYSQTAEPLRSIAARFGVDPSYPTLACRRLGLPGRNPAQSARIKAARKAVRP